MAEHLSTSNGREKSEPSVERPVRYPTEEELREFEAVRRDFAGEPFTTIEKYARDPANPTETEIKAVADVNETFRDESPSFEDYFGYPDPREQEDDQRPRPDDHA